MATLVRDKQIKTDSFVFGSATQASVVTIKGGGTNAGTFTIEGDIICRNLDVNGTTNTINILTIDTNATITDNLTVNGNTTLGNAASDSTIVNGSLKCQLAGGQTWWDASATPVQKASIAGDTGNFSTAGTLTVGGVSTLGGTVTITGDVLPSATNTYNLGSSTKKWKAVFSEITADTLNIPGTTANTFTLDTDNTGGDVALQFGTTLAEQLKWNATAGRFEFTDDLLVPLTLEVTGATDLNSTVAIAGDVTLDKATAQSITSSQALTIATSAGTLTLNPTTTVEVSKNMNANAGVDITGADLTVGGTKFTAAVATGNIATEGTLTVAGQATFSGTVVKLQAAADFEMYDASATPVLKFAIDGATGNLSLAGTVDGVEISTASNYIFNEVSSTTPNGTVTVFAVANTYLAGKIMVFLNGIKCKKNDTGVNGYTETGSGTTITFAEAPLTGDSVEFTYVKTV